MAFRDDTDALRARVESLESDLGEANSKIAILEGGDENANSDLLPKPKLRWKRRTRTFHGELTPADHERIVQMVQKASGKNPVTTSLVGRILTLKSAFMEVMVMPGEGDELVLILDDYQGSPHVVAIGLMIITLMMSLGVAVDGAPTGAAVFLAIGVALSFLAYTKTNKGIAKTADVRTELFARLGTLIGDRTSKVRVETGESGASAEVAAVEDAATMEVDSAD